MSRIYNVALLIETSRSYGRKMLGGIANYARAHGRWAFHLVPGDLVQTLPSRNVWDGDGIIARVETSALARQLARRNLPTVILNRRFASERWPGVGGNQLIACRMIGEHFLTRGFRRLAYCGMADLDYARSRKDDFKAFLNENGIEPEVFWYAQGGQHSSREQARLIEWLKRLAKPVGLFACDDLFARKIIDACRAGDVAVPEEAAVVGFDNDEPLCELAEPPLSSMANNSARIGYEAAALLDQLMSGKSVKEPWLEVDPLGIVTRKSSDRWAIEDADVAAAVRYIRENAANPI
jgi:LacI family transcriptional regulator